MKYLLILSGFIFSFAVISCNNSNKSSKTEKDSATEKTDKMMADKPDSPKIIAAETHDTTGKNVTMKGELEFLRDMDGKYPGAIKLFDKTAFTDRLKKLLGDRYTFLKKTWAVENPIELKNNVFVAWGCEQHNCSSTNFMIVVDLSKDKMYAGVREEEKVRTYTEDNNIPAELQKWASGD